MKLVRLATDNDGVFASAFQNDMIISPQSQMALLNLTFQSNYNVLSINDNNNKITFKSNEQVAGTESSSTLNELNYSVTDYNDFFKDLEHNLNSAIADADLENCMSTEWKIRTYSDRKRLEYRYAPFFNPLNMLLGGNGSQVFSLMRFKTADFEVTTGASPAEKTNIKKAIAGVPTTDRTCAMVTYAKMSLGNGLLLIRPVVSVDNGSGIQDNGFGIGLTKSNLADPDIFQIGDDIPASRRDFEMRYNRPTENYVYIDDDGFEKDSLVPPALVNGGDLVDHDILYYKTGGGKVEGGVLQMGQQEYRDLASVSWSQDPGGIVETFDRINLGEIARFRRLQPSNPGLEHWFEPTSATVFNVYFTGPPIIGQTPNTTATIVPATGVITISGVTFSPSSVPGLVTNAGAYRRKFFSVDIKPGETLTPYLYLRGSQGQIEVDTFNYSLDPWINQNYSENATNDYEEDDLQGWPVTGLDFSGMPANAYTNSVLSITTGGNIFEGTGQDAFALPTPVSWQQTKVSELTMHSDIWKFLGFSDVPTGVNVKKKFNIGIGSATSEVEKQCWSWFIGNVEVLPSNSDNYLVESMSLPLDSFDASQISYPLVSEAYLNPASDKRGRRKNILMTIPVNDNSNNIVEYEASTPVFIDINNAEEINAKNLNFRILNKNFDSIEQSGETAIMTILIKKQNE